jgi:DNA anti-recombination protein RmuC
VASSGWQTYAKLGRQLNSAVNAYNQRTASFDARVLPQARRLKETRAGSEKPVPPLAGLDTPAKLIVATELAEAPEPDTADPPPAEAA